MKFLRTVTGNITIRSHWDDKEIMDRVLLKLGQGDWKVDIHKNGNIVSYEAKLSQ